MNNNIQSLKVFSILLVIIGHSGVLPVNIWIPVTLVLLPPILPIKGIILIIASNSFGKIK